MEPDVHANLHVPSEASASSNLNKFSKPTALPCQDLHLKNDAFFLEICAGSARVTSCLQHLGLKASFGVDHKRQKNAGRLLVADLTSKEGQALCWKWIRSPNCVGIFVAPPCGTCSRARGMPVRLPHGKNHSRTNASSIRSVPRRPSLSGWRKSCSCKCGECPVQIYPRNLPLLHRCWPDRLH